MAGSHAATPTVINSPTIMEIGPPIKLCMNCKHARFGVGAAQWDDSAACYRTIQTSFVTGKAVSLRWCANERNHVGACGPDAKFFEERE